MDAGINAGAEKMAETKQSQNHNHVGAKASKRKGNKQIEKTMIQQRPFVDSGYKHRGIYQSRC